MPTLSPRVLLLLVSAFPLAGIALAAEDTGSSTHSCAAIGDAGARLACYDEAFPPDAGAVASATEAERKQARQDFGLSGVDLRELRPDDPRHSVDRIEATITRISHHETGERVLTLDNGQVWLLTEVRSRGLLAEGDRVVVRKAAMGSFMLVTPGRASLRARRVQ